jgi:aminopeptidase N
MADLFEAWEDAGAGDLSAWTDAWLRTAGVDLLRMARTDSGAELVKLPPAVFPAAREHALAVARHDSRLGWVREPLVVAAERTPLPSVSPGEPVVLDPRDETWARLDLDSVTLDALPRLLPAMADPVMRAAVWNAVRDGVHNALVDPDRALGLLEAALPHEDHDVAVATLAKFALQTLVHRLARDEGAALRRFRGAAVALLEGAAPGSGVQLAAMRAVIAAGEDADALHRWLAGEGLPAGVAVDLDLRWRLLIRLATLGAVTRGELERRLAEEPTAQSKRDFAESLASLPDAEAKEWAWARFSGAADASNYEIAAAGHGMWRPGQGRLTDEYVERYFAEAPATARIRSGWLLFDAARVFYPRLSVNPRTLGLAEAALADPALDPSLRRAVGDETDDLARAVRVREAFGRA